MSDNQNNNNSLGPELLKLIRLRLTKSEGLVPVDTHAQKLDFERENRQIPTNN